MSHALSSVAAVAPSHPLQWSDRSGYHRRVGELKLDAALSPTLSDDAAEEAVRDHECNKSDSATLGDEVEKRFTPYRETVDELLRKELTSQQLRAIDLLLGGMNDSAAARAVGVHRVTLGRWRRYHPGFVAELNRRRDIDLQSAGDRLRGLAQRAISILENRMANDAEPELQLKAAIALLRLAGIGTAAQRIGETSADDMIEKRALAKRKEEKQGMVDDGERENVIIDLARRADSAEVVDWRNQPEEPVDEEVDAENESVETADAGVCEDLAVDAGPPAARPAREMPGFGANGARFTGHRENAEPDLRKSIETPQYPVQSNSKGST